jgi:hypothetical protein
LASPESNPDVAALVLVRTGRRVWQAKKADIIDALVEISEKKGQYLPPRTDVEIGQPELALTANAVGGDAPLFDRPADLGVPGMERIVDADGIEQLVPVTRYERRGLDAATRENMIATVMQKLRDEGQIQPPVTPVPNRPITEFEQGSLADELLRDPTGQLSLDLATGRTPLYRASGKGADDWLDEMRMRLQFDLLDGEAVKAQREAFLAERGWAGMSWEEKKASGLLSKGFYSLQPYADRFQDSTPVFNPELAVAGGRAPEEYRRGPDAIEVQAASSGLTAEGLTAQIGVVQARMVQLKGTKTKAGTAELAQQTALLADLKTRLAAVKEAAQPRAPRPYHFDAEGNLVAAKAEVTATPTKEAVAKPAPATAAKAAPATAAKAAPADGPGDQSRVGMGKAVNNRRNLRDLEQAREVMAKRLAELRQTQTKGGLC